MEEEEEEEEEEEAEAIWYPTWTVPTCSHVFFLGKLIYVFLEDDDDEDDDDEDEEEAEEDDEAEEVALARGRSSLVSYLDSSRLSLCFLASCFMCSWRRRRRRRRR